MQTSFTQTNNLSLAAALAAVGIPFHAEQPFIKAVSEKGTQYTFFFEGVSNCGKFQTTELMRAWGNPEWHDENPEHPFAYIKCAFQNREGLLDQVKQAVELVQFEKGGKIALISKNADFQTQNVIFGNL